MDTGFEQAAVSWSSRAADLKGLSANGTQLVIPASRLPVIGEVDVTATFTLQGRSSSSTAIVSMDGAPYCTQAACMTTTVVNDTFPEAVYTATVSGVLDDGPLT
jgi:hypothetical protein